MKGVLQSWIEDRSWGENAKIWRLSAYCPRGLSAPPPIDALAVGRGWQALLGGCFLHFAAPSCVFRGQAWGLHFAMQQRPFHLTRIARHMHHSKEQAPSDCSHDSDAPKQPLHGGGTHHARRAGTAVAAPGSKPPLQPLLLPPPPQWPARQKKRWPPYWAGLRRSASPSFSPRKSCSTRCAAPAKASALASCSFGT